MDIARLYGVERDGRSPEPRRGSQAGDGLPAYRTHRGSGRGQIPAGDPGRLGGGRRSRRRGRDGVRLKVLGYGSGRRHRPRQVLRHLAVRHRWSAARAG